VLKVRCGVFVVSRVRHIDGVPIAVRTASCNRRHEDNGSLSGEKAEDEESTLEENERAWDMCVTCNTRPSDE
jgi:hypothetical protein